MAAKLKYGFLCDGAMNVHGKWTFQGVFNQIIAASYPAIHPESVLTFEFNGPVGAHTLRIQFLDSSGKQLMNEIRQPIECREFHDNHVNVKIQALPVPSAGFYSFKLSLDEDAKPFGEIEFQAILLKSKSGPAEKEA